MKLQPYFSKIVTLLARLVGVIWIVGGMIALLSAFLFTEDRILETSFAVFLIATGIGLLIAKQPSSNDIDLMRRFVDRLKGHRSS